MSGLRGALLVAGTGSDAGKSVVVTGICRWLARRGVRVAPFKAQNMALNSVVTAEGAEIGRAQAAQAAAAGVPPEAAMNPVLLKPAGERRSHVMLMGKPYGEVDARSYGPMRAALREPVLDALADLRARFDVVVCEGAGSPAEINLRENDLANMGLARAADLPVVIVGDIDRGGVFAGLFGCLALLEPEDQRLVSAFVINKFRGDLGILRPGLEMLERLTGRPTLGVLPWRRRLGLDAEDSLALEAPREAAEPPTGPDALEVAVIRLRWMSNFTDLDALAAEPGVAVRFTRSPADVARADLVVLPGTRATVEDLARLRADGLDAALRARAARGGAILGICGGYQMLGRRIVDEVESRSGEVAGLGLLPADTVFGEEKILRRRTGAAADFGGAPAAGFEIRHGRVEPDGGAPLLRTGDGDEGCRVGGTIGTSWHGLLEGDELRRALLSWAAEIAGRRWLPGATPFAEVRERRLDAVADLIEQNLDTAALEALIAGGAPAGLPVLESRAVAVSQ
ncbi:MAG: adenosylcobyric acid synthase [Miltoncostaeaceae bacterium]|nr:adenosylcobyric acid synthase [Miltoncostaeaceae bacterium]